jgi:PKHD-type hydroxylase
MNAMWQLWEGRFSKEFCERIVSLASLLPERQATVGGGDGDSRTDLQIRKSKVRWLNGAMPDFKDFYLDVVDMFREANRHAFGAELWHLHEMQFTQYDAADEGFYNWHNDVMWASPNCGHRKLSMVIQLSDPSEYEGGDLEIQPLHLGAPDPAILRKQGNVIVFPSFLMHRVTPVTKGTRYSLVAWMEGPKWR